MSFLAAFGLALPARVVSNEELAPLLGTTPEAILGGSGIENRRWASEEETVFSLGAAAATDCLSASGLTTSELGLLIVSSGTAEHRFPGPASAIAAAIGCEETPAIDVPVASAGSIFGLTLAARLAPSFGPVLVVASEIMSRPAMTEPIAPGTSMLFGDGAGACLVRPDRGLARVLRTQIASDGKYGGDLYLDCGGPISMNGRSVILHASRKMPRAIHSVVSGAGLTPADIDAFLIHQANQNLMDRVAGAVKAEPSRFFSNIRNYGNTSSASLLIAATEWQRQAGFRPGLRVCFVGFGAGYHWGALLAEGV